MSTDPTRATLVRNPDYERDGLKSYVRALQKYGIKPTVLGPYRHSSQVTPPFEGIIAAEYVTKPLNRAHRLLKRDAESGRTGQVPVCVYRRHNSCLSLDVLIQLRPKTSNTTLCTLPKSALARHRRPSS